MVSHFSAGQLFKKKRKKKKKLILCVCIYINTPLVVSQAKKFPPSGSGHHVLLVWKLLMTIAATIGISTQKTNPRKTKGFLLPEGNVHVFGAGF